MTEAREKIVATLEAWQDEGTDYVVSHGFNAIAHEILTLEGDNWRIAVVEKDVIADILRGDWLKEVEK